jgi:hypothetical protein
VKGWGGWAMTDEAKLGLVAGVLAVLGVAVFGFPRQPAAAEPPAAVAAAGTPTAPPGLPPAAVVVPQK